MPGDALHYSTDEDFDLEAWLGLYRTSGWYPKGTVEDLRVLRAHAFAVVTAWQGSELVGTLTVLSDGRNYATFDDIVVHPDHRRRGIGSELLRRALILLGNIDPGVIKLVSIPGVEPFYERNGFRPTGETVMSRWQGDT